jgi:hypothetical protein
MADEMLEFLYLTNDVAAVAKFGEQGKPLSR